jgi:hypothetical protein
MTAKLTLSPKDAAEIANFYKAQIEYYNRLNDQYMEKMFRVRYDAAIQVIDKYLTNTIDEFDIKIKNSKIYQYALGIIGNNQGDFLQRALPAQMTIDDATIIEDVTTVKEQIEYSEKLNKEADLQVPKREIAEKVINAVDNNRVFSVNTKLLDYLKEHPEDKALDKNDIILKIAIKEGRDVFKPVRDIAANIMQYSSIVGAKHRLRTMLYGWENVEIERFMRESALLLQRKLSEFKLGRKKEYDGKTERSVYIDAPKGTPQELLEALLNREEAAYLKIQKDADTEEPSLRRECARAFVGIIPHGKEYAKNRKELIQRWRESGDPAYLAAKNK